MFRGEVCLRKYLPFLSFTSSFLFFVAFFFFNKKKKPTSLLAFQIVFEGSQLFVGRKEEASSKSKSSAWPRQWCCSCARDVGTASGGVSTWVSSLRAFCTRDLLKVTGQLVDAGTELEHPYSPKITTRLRSRSDQSLVSVSQRKQL